jgi:hypothetical protein
MSSAISSSRAGGASAVGLGGASGGKGGAGAAMGGLAANIAGTIAGELKLAVDPDGRRKPGGHDLYDVDETADALVSELGGTGADRGRVAQALHAFAREIASLVVAQPDSRALEQVETAITKAAETEAKAGNAPASVASVLAMIGHTTAMIAGPKS